MEEKLDIASFDIRKMIAETGTVKLGDVTITKIYNLIDAAKKAYTSGEDTSGYSRRDYYEGLRAISEALMKRVDLTSAQAFSKLVTDNNIGKLLFAAHRRAPGSDCTPEEARQTPNRKSLPISDEERPALTLLTEKATKLHRDHPELTSAQAFAKVYEAKENSALRAEERAERRALAAKFAQ